MSILLTGATGFIGRAVLHRLIAEAYRVTALVESEEDADAVQAAGATAFLAAEGDTRTVSELALESDAVVHTATSRMGDPGFVDAVLSGLEGGDKPFVYTSNLWIYGSNLDITESSPFAPAEPVSWVVDVQKRLLAEDGVRCVVVVPGVVYGHGQGIPRQLVDGIDSGRTPAVVPLVGSGSQHWATVHVDDLADLYLRILEAESHSNEIYIAANGDHPTVTELGEAAAEATNADPRPESSHDAAERFGAALAEVLLLDQRAEGAKARNRLGWRPRRPSLVDELRAGYIDIAGDPLWT